MRHRRRAIGSLVGTTAKDGIECTAALIAPGFLLTAAHCVYVPNSGYLGNLRCEVHLLRKSPHPWMLGDRV